MAPMDQIAHDLLGLLLGLVHLVFAAVAVIEGWLRGLLAPLHLSSDLETLVLLLVGALLLLAALRLFGGLIRALLVIVLLVVLIEVLVPSLGHRGQNPGGSLQVPPVTDDH